MRKVKQLLALVMSMTLLLNLAISGAVTNTDVSITSSILPTENNREFEVKYTVDVDGQVTKVPSVVLVLDRSGSMLFEDANGNLVVNSVKSAVSSFITSYFDNNSNGQLAIVSFGTYIDISNNGNYYTRASDAQAAVNYIYQYSYSYYYSWYYGYYREYYWSHWNSNQGGTNIGEAFQTAANVVNNHNNTDTNEVIVLFSDGVANIYKSGYNYYSTSNYPTSANNSTVYATTQGQNAQNVADVITVGYLGAYNNDRATQVLASNTLDAAQNAGYFTTNDIGYVGQLFEAVANNLDYIGTDTTITDVINAEFDVVPGSIVPSGATVSVNPTTGQTTITWDVGNLTNGEHEYSYKVKAKDNIYPSGKDDVIVNNISAQNVGLKYTDLDRNIQRVAIPEARIDIPSHDIIPGVDLSITHMNSASKEYLIGDIAVINHDLYFSNELVDSNEGSIMFDFTQIDVKKYTKELVYASSVPSDEQKPFDEVFKLNTPSWDLTDNTLEYNIDETAKNSNPASLEWRKELVLEMECLAVGDFDFKHTIAFDLYNPYSSTPFPQTPENLIEDEIKVANGTAIFELTSLTGDPINSANIIFNDGNASTANIESDNYDRTVINNGEYTIDHLKSGTYTITIEIPSGYKIPDGSALKLTDGTPFTLDTNGNIVIASQSLNYRNSELVFGMEFESLDVGNIAITTAAGANSLYTNSVTKDIPIKMTFSPMVDMTYLRLILADSFSGTGDIQYNTSSLVVKDSAGNVVNGFTLVHNNNGTARLDFKNSNTGAPAYLAIGDYTAEFTISDLPAGLKSTVAPGYVFDLTVNTTKSTRLGTSSVKVASASAKELTINYDEIAPVIVFAPSSTEYTESNVSVDVTITDGFSTIVDYRLVRVSSSTATVGDFNGKALGYGFASLPVITSQRIEGDFEVTINSLAVESAATGLYKGNGFFAVIATDQAGNTSIKVIQVNNLIKFNEIQGLL